MAEVKKATRVCQGCGRKSDNAQHCQYPSNPLVNAQSPEKRAPLHTGGIPSLRRGKAAAIKARNATSQFGGGSSGGWWEGNPRLVKVGTAEKGGGDIFAMMSQRYGTKAG